MPWTRASSLHRALACPGSTVLPVHDLRGTSAREAAAWGTLAHHWKATGEVPDGPLAKLFRKKLDTCWGPAAEECRVILWPDDGVHELSVAVNCAADGVVEWERTDDPDTWKAQFGPEWITGTLDYVGDILGDPWIDDLKTGRVPPVPDEPQTLVYALAVWLMRRREPDRAVLSITHWPRYPVLCYPDRVDIDAPAKVLDDFYRECKIGYIEHGNAAAAAARGSVLEFLFPGPQCRYCPSASVCPVEESVNGP